MERMKMDEEGRRKKLQEIILGEESGSEIQEIALQFGGLIKEEEGIKISPVTYKSRPIPVCRTGDQGQLVKRYKQERIPAYLLEPGGWKNGAAIVALHQSNLEYELGGDEPAGLIGNPDQHYGLELAKKGFLVIAPDALPYGRRYHRERFGGLARGEEQFANQTANHNGMSYVGRLVLDAMRAVDVLFHREASKIGLIGHSFGGISTIFTAAADSRVTAAVISCGFGSYDSIDDAEYLHGHAVASPGAFRREFVDMYSLLGLCENRHLFISAGTEDRSFPLAGIGRSVELARRRYGMDEKHLELSLFEGGHDFPAEQRQKAYQFLERHL